MDANVADMWSLWTTPDGIESWWGPDGFTTRATGPDVRMVLTFDPMHDEDWTQRMIAGHESQLSKLESILPKT